METNKNYYINNIFSLLILGSIVLSLFDAFIIGDTSTVKLISIGFALICIIIFILRSSVFYFNQLLIIIFVWVFYNLIWLLLTYNQYYFSVIFQQLVLLLFVWSASNGDSPLKSIKQLKIVIVVYQIFAIYFMIFTERTGFSTPLFAFTFFSLAMVSGTWKKVALCFLYMVVFWDSGDRSRVLALLVIALCIIILPKLGKRLYKVTFWTVTSIIILIPKIYLWMYNMSESSQWNVWVREFSGKNLFSGRQHLWGYLENYLSNHQLFGHGGNLVGGEFSVNYMFGMSSHNLFLFLRGQGGYLLLFLFVLFLYYIWLRFYNHLSNPYVLVGAAYLIGLLVRTSFDLVLMANNFVDSLYLWLPLVISLSLAQNMSRNKQTMQEPG
ncbi:hypothetical protein ACERII_18505 [Evansella sp. AB-rgal1]|uniref:hypothetical protein n=1 Tax=Evansella sp. AB-rgal1 TaxID=3242696 RepID=UPI00359DB936